MSISSSDINVFLYEDPNNGVIIDQDKKDVFTIIEDPFKKSILELESMKWKDTQLEKVIEVHRQLKQDMKYINVRIPIFFQNLTEEIIETHVPMKFSDHVVLYNFKIIDLFLVGILNEEVKKLYENCENDTRKVMIFLSLNHSNVMNNQLNSFRKINREFCGQIEINNNAIRLNQFQYAKKTKDIISLYQYNYNDVEVGEIKVITSPNFILNRICNIIDDGLRFFIKMTLHSDKSADLTGIKQKKITRILPLKICSVNRDSYDSLHLFKNFNDETLKQKSDDDKKEFLKTNCNMLIGILSQENNQTIDFPVFSTLDTISISLIVSYNKLSKIINEEKRIEIGKLRSDNSQLEINKLMISMLNIVNCKLKSQNIEEHISLSEDADLLSALSFKSMYKNNNIEEMYPILTQLRISDFKHYSEIDIAKILAKKRYDLKQIITSSSGGSSLFITSGIIGFYNEFLKCNGKVWIDCFWWLNNHVCKQVLDAWTMCIHELSTEARLSSIDLFYNRNLYIKPLGIDDQSYKDIRGQTLRQFNFKNILNKYAKLMIYQSILENTQTKIYAPFKFDAIDFSSKIADDSNDTISSSIEFQSLYQNSMLQYDINQKIKTICQNTATLINSSKKIPFNVIFANYSVEIDIDKLRRELNPSESNDNKFIPDEILDYLFCAFNMISMFTKDNYYVSEFESSSLPETSGPYASNLPSCSSNPDVSRSSDDHFKSLDDMIEEESKMIKEKTKKPTKVKIIMIKKLNDLFPL